MRFKFANLVITALVVVSATACSQVPSKSTEPPSEPAKPSISSEARKALDQADSDVVMAREKFALWTSAEIALKQAHEATLAGDSAAVIKLATFTSEQVKSGLDQLSYPPTELK